MQATSRQAGAIYSITEHKSEMMFCGPCIYVLGIIQNGQIPDRDIPHHETISDCKRAIEAGCLLCRRLELSKHTDHGVMRLFAKILRFSVSYGPDWSLLIYGSPITTDEDGRDEKISEQRRMLVGAFQLRPVVNGKGQCLWHLLHNL